MRKTVLLKKEIGQTPLETIQEWKLAHPKYKDVPASYAGRLDPMASGKLLVLLGEECKKQAKYIKRDKTYEVEVLLDVGSDTGDVLGIVRAFLKKPSPLLLPSLKRSPYSLYASRFLSIAPRIWPFLKRSRTEPVHNEAENNILNILEEEVGTQMLPYPIYSSKTVAGKPLFLYALEGTLDTISIPTHEETIYRIQLRSITTVSQARLRERVLGLLKLAPTSDEPSKVLGADFRIKEVRASWDEVFNVPDRTYTTLRLKVSCASGSYMRSLAGRLGERLGTNALALSINRTKIG